MFAMKSTYLAVLLELACVYSAGGQSGRRNARFLSFDTSVDGDIAVDLDFTVPFLKIPIKKTMESAFQSDIIFPTININVVGLALGGIIILGTAFILPFLTKHYAIQDPNARLSKLTDNSRMSVDDVLEFGSKLLHNAGGIQECSLRLACLAARQCSPAGENSRRLLKQITSNDILSAIMNTTPLDDAIDIGWNGRECAHECPMKDEQLHAIITNMVGLNT